MRNLRMTIRVIAIVLFLVNSQLMAWIQFSDGGTYNIDYRIKNDVRVDYQTPGMETIVNLLDEGEISRKLQGYEDSYLNIFGGLVRKHLSVCDSSQVNIFGGLVRKGLRIDNNAILTIYGSDLALMERFLVMANLPAYLEGIGAVNLADI